MSARHIESSRVFSAYAFCVAGDDGALPVNPPQFYPLQVLQSIFTRISPQTPVAWCTASVMSAAKGPAKPISPSP